MFFVINRIIKLMENVNIKCLKALLFILLKKKKKNTMDINSI